MPRTLGGLVSGMVRASIRAAEQAHRAAVRERQRETRRMEREAKANRCAARQAQVDSENAELRWRISELYLLVRSLPQADSHECVFSFEQLKKDFTPESFDPVGACGPQPAAPHPQDFRTHIPSPGWLSRLFGGQSRYEFKAKNAGERDRVRFKEAERIYASALRQWEGEVNTAREKHGRELDAKRIEIIEHNARIDRLKHLFLARDEASVAEYFYGALARLDHPKEFAGQFRIEYQRGENCLIIEYAFPGDEIVPEISSYRYLKTKDEIREKRRPQKEIAQIYSEIVNAFARRTIVAVFSADPNGTVHLARFFGYAPRKQDDPVNARKQIVSISATQKDYLERRVCSNR